MPELWLPSWDAVSTTRYPPRRNQATNWKETSMKKVGVTGGMGFIGRYVVEELQDNGLVPVIFDHHRRSPGEYDRDVEVFFGDVRDETAMTEFAAHVDGMIHLAAVLGTQETIHNPRPAALSNLMGGLNFLEAC